MAVVAMLLQSGFMISHSQACCCRGGSHMRHSRAPWLRYRMHTRQFRPLSTKWVHLGIRYIGVV